MLDGFERISTSSWLSGALVEVNRFNTTGTAFL
jgi:hypothetical protein